MITYFTEFQPQGVYLKKNWQGGSAYFFGSEIFEILIFLGLENLSYFLGSNDFSLIFLGNNFDTIYFFGCPIKRSWFAKPLTQIPSNFGKQNNNINEWR